jgi:hypothetical protein
VVFDERRYFTRKFNKTPIPENASAAAMSALEISNALEKGLLLNLA